MNFIDSDAAIRTEAGMSINELCKTCGEQRFKDLEARVIARALKQGPAVLATGSDSFIHDETRSLIHDKAVSIRLKADTDVVVRRNKGRSGRRLLQPPTRRRPSQSRSVSVRWSIKLPISRSPRAMCRRKIRWRTAWRRCTPTFAVRRKPPGCPRLSWKRRNDHAAQPCELPNVAFGDPGSDILVVGLVRERIAARTAILVERKLCNVDCSLQDDRARSSRSPYQPTSAVPMDRAGKVVDALKRSSSTPFERGARST
ncbi:hypothetical protein GRB70_39530 [Bradyrhizobium neotropicale]|nr:hypothetical protein [Bradyrhizobium neotropicale]